MNFTEISFWNHKVKLYERTWELVNSQPAKNQVSFYQGMALLLSESYLDSENSDVAKYGSVTQRAA